jgi:hypothetical protein
MTLDEALDNAAEVLAKAAIRIAREEAENAEAA